LVVLDALDVVTTWVSNEPNPYDPEFAFDPPPPLVKVAEKI
jgi:hypothetical protein